jgi:catechol 2,3-dioxygenase-like lactoylglutathione lyase family enzyme
MRAIDHVGLTVADLDRAVDFWCGRLGLRLLGRVTETGPDIAALLGEDAVELEIADLDAGDGRIVERIRYIRPAGRPARARSGDPGSCHIALRVDDLDAAVERIQGSQARQISRHPVVLHDPGGAWDGVACCYIADPDGNIVELVQRPSAEPQQLPSLC